MRSLAPLLWSNLYSHRVMGVLTDPILVQVVALSSLLYQDHACFPLMHVNVDILVLDVDFGFF